MRIFFTRHGESRANLLHQISNRELQHGLTPKGCAQAEALAFRLQGQEITHIFSSPLLRAVQTSEILASRLKLPFEITDALREYDCGILEGRADKDAWMQWQQLFDAWVERKEWDRKLEGGESFHDLRSRFQPFIDRLIARYGDTPANLVCVSHGGLYWMMLPLMISNVSTALIRQYGFDYTSSVETVLQPEGLVCVAWNDHRLAASNDLQAGA